MEQMLCFQIKENFCNQEISIEKFIDWSCFSSRNVFEFFGSHYFKTGADNLFRFACRNRLNQWQNSYACQPKIVRTYYLTSLKVYVNNLEEMVQIHPNSENTI